MRTCPHCGSPLPRYHDPFCPDCRRSLDELPDSQVEANQAPGRIYQRNGLTRKAIILLVSGGLLLLLGFILQPTWSVLGYLAIFIGMDLIIYGIGAVLKEVPISQAQKPIEPMTFVPPRPPERLP